MESEVCLLEEKTGSRLGQIQSQEEVIVVDSQPQARNLGGKKEREQNRVRKTETGRPNNKLPILVIGDSMVKNTRAHVSMRAKGSKLASLRGKGVDSIAMEARQSVESVNEGMVVLQGGGNSLREDGPKRTAEKMLECVRQMKKDRKKVRIGIIGILRRPKEGSGYEEMRREANWMMQKGIQEMKLSMLGDRQDYGVSFLDMDNVLPRQVYGSDGVHLDWKGEKWMCGRILEWIKATERMHESKNRVNGQ